MRIPHWLMRMRKGLLAVPFVLHSQPTTVLNDDNGNVAHMASTAHRRYAEILSDVEALIIDHISHQHTNPASSKLKNLVPTIGAFFTPLPLSAAFTHQDATRRISSRRFVAPSFNDVRAILNTAQVLALCHPRSLNLITFDGDVTLYDDGGNLDAANPSIPRILTLMEYGVSVAIVTAAGYTEPEKYYDRLSGVVDAIAAHPGLRADFAVMGGESNYLFRLDRRSACKLAPVPREQWALREMLAWRDDDIEALLELAEAALRESIKTLNLDASILRKHRAVGMVPAAAGGKFSREALEETVLVTQKILESSPQGTRIPFCAFNGGNDVFVDIGDKSLGVRACQNFLGGVPGARTLHVGDQFLSAGANDFKARQACTTAWVVGVGETVGVLDELVAGLREGRAEALERAHE